MDAAAELRKIPGVSTRFSLNMEISRQADAGRDCLARPIFQARTRTGKYLFFPLCNQLTTIGIGSLTRLNFTLALYIGNKYHKVPAVSTHEITTSLKSRFRRTHRTV